MESWGTLVPQYLENTTVKQQPRDISVKCMEKTGDWRVSCNCCFHQYASHVNSHPSPTNEWCRSSRMVSETGGRVGHHFMLVLQDIPNSSSAAAVNEKASECPLLFVLQDLHFLYDTEHCPRKAFGTLFLQGMEYRYPVIVV